MVAAVDAPSIYDIPKVLHREGLDAYVVRRLGPAVPRRATGPSWDELLRRVHRPANEVDGRARRQVRRPAGRLPVGHRGAARRRLRQRRAGRPALGAPPTTARRPRALRADARRRRRRLHPRRVRRPRASRARSARCAGPARTRSRRSGCASACSAWSSSSPATWPASRTPTARSSTRRRRTRSSPRWPTRSDVVAGERRHGRHDAARARTRRCWPRARSSREVVRREPGRGAAPAPLRGQQRLPRAARGGRPGLLRHLAGRLARRVRRAARARCTRTTSATQAHPEFRSRPDRAHPLFAGLVAAALERAGQRSGCSSVVRDARRPCVSRP